MSTGVYAHLQISVFVSFGEIYLRICVCTYLGMIAGSLSMFKPYRWSNTVCILLLLSHFIQSSVLETFILLHNLCFFHFCCHLVFVVWICAVSFICSYSCFHVFFFFAMGNSVALSIPGIYFKMRICKNFSWLYAYSLNCWIIVYVHVQLFNLMPNCSQQQSAQFTQHRHSFPSAGSPASPFLKSSQALTPPQVHGKQRERPVLSLIKCLWWARRCCRRWGHNSEWEREDTPLPLLRLKV